MSRIFLSNKRIGQRVQIRPNHMCCPITNANIHNLLSSSSSSESKKEYSPKYGRRSRGAKREPTLRSDGLEFGQGTESSTYVQVLMMVMAKMNNLREYIVLRRKVEHTSDLIKPKQSPTSPPPRQHHISMLLDHLQLVIITKD